MQGIKDAISNLVAPAHPQLTDEQKKEVMDLAESSHSHTQGSTTGVSSTTGGALGNSGPSSGLGAGSSSTGLGSSTAANTGLGNTSTTSSAPVTSGHARTGSRGGGLAAAAGAQGIGGPSAVDRRSFEGERPFEFSQSSASGNHSGATAVGTGALGAAAGAGTLGGLIHNTGSGNNGLSEGKSGRGSTLEEAMHNASNSGSSGHGGALGAGALGAGAGAAGLAGHSSSSSSNNNHHGSDKGTTLLSQPKAPEGGLLNELEERARAKGTHAAGFGVHGNH